MNHKLLIVLFGALTTGAINSQAQLTAPVAAAPAASWTVTGSATSHYMFRGVRYGGPSFQPSVEYVSGRIAAGLWANLPISDKVIGVSDPEIDFYGSYTGTITDALNFTTGLTLYTYPRAENANGFYDWTFEPNVGLNYTIAGLRLSPKLYYDVTLHGATIELNAAYAVPLTDFGTELRFSGTIGTFKWTRAVENSAPETKNYGDYWLLGVALPFQIDTRSSLTVGWAYTKGENNFLKQGTLPKFENTSAVGRGIVTINYALTF